MEQPSVSEINIAYPETGDRHLRISVGACRLDVMPNGQSFQAYTQPEYTELLQDCGFGNIDFVRALTGAPEPDQPDLFVIIACKP